MDMSNDKRRGLYKWKNMCKMFGECVALLGSTLFLSVCPDRVRAGAAQ